MAAIFAWIFAGVAAVATLLAAYFFDKSAEEGISRADENAAHANHMAAQAHERAATLEKQTEELRQENLKLTERLAWRSLPTAGAQKSTENAALPPEMLVIILGDMEAAKFGGDIVAALQSEGIKVTPFRIGSISPPVYGVQHLAQGWSAAAQVALDKIGVATSSAERPIPLPASMQAQFVELPKIIIGIKPPP